MKENKFKDRLSHAMNLRNMKAAALSDKTGIAPPIISDYLAGKYKAKQDKVFLLAEALDVNESWLMGYEAPIERIPDDQRKTDELREKIESLSNEKKELLIKMIDNMM